MFGWHVHEKAILVPLVVLGFLTFTSPQFTRIFYLLTVTGTFSLFPLLFHSQELIIKVFLLGAYAVFLRSSIEAVNFFGADDSG